VLQCNTIKEREAQGKSLKTLDSAATHVSCSVCCSVLQSVLQCVAECVVECVAVCFAVCCVVCCSVLQCDAVWYSKGV